MGQDCIVESRRKKWKGVVRRRQPCIQLVRNTNSGSGYQRRKIEDGGRGVRIDESESEKARRKERGRKKVHMALSR